ncbi:hypothetical protein VB780_07055 [Leptolyngbya sp. CCNP1308]|uniref:hypothetical protein n=1 Tax=Leptolyngbya sp. CCNP1308 TaxID=3110255 RepID=UPI002B1FB6FE|nr:hypothetical protein [Leptolyngbya sp. CCNP1308]MEA5448319.1 hypothetical protein [Leptolyngbya sp. CCNP1308]
MQKSAIACRPLADWLGQNVRFQGYLSHWKTADRTSTRACLLQHIEVVPYKGCKAQARALNHIWLYLSEKALAETQLERFRGYQAVGQVVSYTRSNGTKDFAIDINSYFRIESYLERLNLCAEPRLDHIKVRARLLEKILNLLETEEIDFGIKSSYKEVYQHFQEDYEFCLRQVEINERYEAQKQHRSRPNPDILTFASMSSKATKVACKGFAAS